MLDSAPDQLFAATAADLALFDADHRARYADVITQMALPYRIASGKPQRSTDLVARRADASDGIISSVRDLARFDNALTSGALLASATRTAAWTQATSGGSPLPTGLGWFVQNYHDEPIVWQFGMTRGGYSSLIVKAPNRGLTFIVLANSDGLSAPFALDSGDVTSSLFATLFLRSLRALRFNSVLARAKVLLFLLALSPSAASADWLFTPFVGATFAGSTAGVDLEQGASSTHFMIGGSAGWWSPGWIGFEGDFWLCAPLLRAKQSPRHQAAMH